MAVGAELVGLGRGEQGDGEAAVWEVLQGAGSSPGDCDVGEEDVSWGMGGAVAVAAMLQWPMLILETGGMALEGEARALVVGVVAWMAEGKGRAWVVGEAAWMAEGKGRAWEVGGVTLKLEGKALAVY